MAEAKQYQNLNYAPIKDYKPGITKVTCELNGLKPKKPLLSLGKPAKGATNADVSLKVSESGDMGTIVMKDGKIETKSYQVKIDPNHVGHKWKGEPESSYEIEKDCVIFYLKRDQ